MKKIIAPILLLFNVIAYSQESTLQGTLIDDQGNFLIYATAVLLNPEDSTMAYYGISDENGQFLMKNIKPGNYILQTGFMGFESYFQNIKYPLASGNDLGTILMKSKAQTLGEVEIKGNRIPLLIKKDTVEYIANAFNTKPDAVAEDLLKKLPGIEVDRAGNIKAHGEDVQRVLVDGKEFFTSDPTVATKNLPADAIDKIQVYNKKSDETELSGIDDGSYSKTINMILKEGQKSAYFGDVNSGYGTDDHYQAGTKIFRFTKKYQVAALGMINNINKSGFSFQDYLDFQGGFQNLISGGGGSAHIGLDDDNNMPVDFGQSINGLVTSAAAGLNFTHEARINNRFNISYIGNGSNRKIEESTNSQNYTDDRSFVQDINVDQKTKNRIHRLNYTWRNRIDSTQNLYLSGGVSINNGSSDKTSLTESFMNDQRMNDLYIISTDQSNGFTANSKASYLKTTNGNWKLFKINTNISYNQSVSEAQWNDLKRFFAPVDEFYTERFQEDETAKIDYSVNTSATLKLNSLLYLVPNVAVGATGESIIRVHLLSDTDEIIESLSANFYREYFYITTGLSFKRNTQKSQFDLTTKVENARLTNTLDNVLLENNTYLYFLPTMSWQYQYNEGRRLSINYNTNLNAPSARQLLPIENTTNALQIYVGNSKLIPEYRHNVRISWLLFDQFSSTSIFAHINGTFTQDKIIFNRTINDDLSQKIELINSDEDYRAGGSFDFSTPIRKLGIKLTLRFSENWNRGKSYVNNVENINTNFSHTLSAYFTNRNNEKLDLMIGGQIQISDAKYSIQKSLNNRYVNIKGYSDIRFTPNDSWDFSFSADITKYSEQSFGNEVNIPILRAEINHHFLKSNRGMITLAGHDLLDKNKGIERISEMNYLLEKRSNVLGRYFMLTFKYRLNELDKNISGIKINTRRRGFRH